MAVAYTDRCTASSWRGEGEPPARNRCIYHEQSRTPHTVHRDECGNNFNADRQVVTLNRGAIAS